MQLFYSQNREDLIIRGFFPDVDQGTYIDIGANDPEDDSVTKLFYDAGWSGTNVEPIKRHFDALEAQRPRDVNLNVGVGARAGVLNFTEYPDADGLSTFDAQMAARYSEKDVGLSRTYAVRVITLADVIEASGAKHIHFLKVDVEGSEYDVIRGYSWDDVRPDLLCVEANHIPADRDWRPLLAANNYEFALSDGLNNYYLAAEALPRRKLFDYAGAALARNSVHFRVAEALVYEPEVRLAHAERQLAVRTGQFETKIQELDELHAQDLQRIIELESRVETVRLEASSSVQAFKAAQSALIERDQRIRDLEQQLSSPRLLANHLAAQLDVAFRNLGYSRAARTGHYYRRDRRIHDAVVERAHWTTEDLLALAHERDTENIDIGTLSLRDRVMPVAWRVVSNVYSPSLRTLGRLTRRLR